MRILLSLASIEPARGGPTQAALAMAREFSEMGLFVTTVAHDDALGPSGPIGVAANDLENNQVLKFPISCRRIQFSNAYRKWIKDNIRYYDLVIINSVFLPHTRFVSTAARKGRIPYVIRPHGALNPSDLAKNYAAKRIYLRTIDKKPLDRANFIFTTSEQEKHGIAQWTSTKAEVIPLGVGVEYLSNDRSMARNRYQIAFVGRLTAKKGIEILIDAMQLVRQQYPEATLVVAGPDTDGLEEGLKARVASAGLNAQIRFPGYLSLQPKLDLYASSGIFALPSRDENFGISTAEAMACGLPVVITEGVSHAHAVQNAGSGIICDRSHESVAAAIVKVMSESDEEYQLRSTAAHDLAKESYSWRLCCEGVLRSAAGTRTK